MVGIKKTSTGEFFGLNDMIALPNYLIGDSVPVIDVSGKVQEGDKDEFHNAVGEEEEKKQE